MMFERCAMPSVTSLLSALSFAVLFECCAFQLALMDPPIHRPSRGVREPAAQVKRLESQAVLPSQHKSSASPPVRSPSRSSNDTNYSQDDYSNESPPNRSSFTKGASTSFEAMRATVAEDRRREHRTPSTAPSPIVSKLRKAHYLKSNKARFPVTAPTRART